VTEAVAGALAFLLGLGGAAVLTVGALVTLPAAVAGAAVAALVVSVLVTAICAFADVRRSGRGFWRSIGRSSAMALRWCLLLLP
jgi:hypothetical protein